MAELAIFKLPMSFDQFWCWIAAAFLLFVSRSPTVIGYVGELKLRFVTNLLLDGKVYHPFHNIVLPTPDGTTQVDHILISRHGIFVIETKNMKGWIFGDQRQRQWTQVRFRRRHKFMNPLHQNFKHIQAAREAIDASPQAFQSVVVFVGPGRFKTEMPSNVIRLREFRRYIKSCTLRLLDEDEVQRAVCQLKQRRLSSPLSRWTHLRSLRRNLEHPLCPRCGKEMVLRTARRGPRAGNQFWGCSGYPQCKATRGVA
jgi:hypothetical protein